MIEPSTSARRALVACVALAAALAAVPADAAGSTAARRIAVVVGANRAPAGRPSLRYAHSDAEEIARVLIDVAAFAPDDVHVLLDPTPGAVLRGLDSALATLAGQDEALLFFYYSGHSDAGSLYPAGQPLPLSELKRRLEDSRASVRVGVVDACSGGAWTGAKGVHPAEPFVVEVPFTLGAEGSALLAASSGAENANEYERIGGSFFTHHLVAGLRGGAERDGDGVIGLNEAFEYAKAGTLRDSAIYAPLPQHPSFVMNLRGRSDLPLARLAGAATRVDLQQSVGPLQVIRLDQALVVLEIPAGPRRMTLALAPGKYLVRRRSDGQTFAKEVQVVSGRAVEVREESLVLVGDRKLAAKGTEVELPPQIQTSLPGGTWELSFLYGYNSNPLTTASEKGRWINGGLSVGLTDRLQFSLLPFTHLAYRFGDAGGPELLLHLGTDGYLRTDKHALEALYPTTGAVLRIPVDAEAALVAGVSVTTSLWLADSTDIKGRPIDSFNEWLFSAQAGAVIRFLDRVVVYPGVEARVDKGTIIEESTVSWAIGSTLDLQRGARPLVQVELGRGFTLDGHAALEWEGPPPLKSMERYGLGASWVF